MNHADAPYVITKPLHPTQKILSSDDAGIVFSMKVILNFELEREILGFGARMRIFGPRNLRKRIVGQLREALEFYG